MSLGTVATEERVAGLFPGHTFMSSFKGGRAELGMNQLLLLRDRLRYESDLDVAAPELARTVLKLAEAKRLVIFGIGRELYFIAGADAQDVLACEQANQALPPEVEYARLTQPDVIRIGRMTSARRVLEELGGQATSWTYKPAIRRELGINNNAADQVLLLLKPAGMVEGIYPPGAKSAARHIGAYKLGAPFSIERYLQAREVLRQKQAHRNRAKGHAPYREFNAGRLNQGPRRLADRDGLIQRILFEATGATGACDRSAVEVVQKHLDLSRTTVLAHLRSLTEQGNFKGFRGKKYFEVADPDDDTPRGDDHGEG